MRRKPPLILVHLALNIVFIFRKHFQAAGYRIFENYKNSKFRLPHSLTNHSCKARDQKKQRMATMLRHKNKLTGGMCLLGFQRACSLCTLPFFLSSIRPFFKQQNHINLLISLINSFLEQRIQTPQHYLKRLHYSRGTGQAQIQYFECKIRGGEKIVGVGVAAQILL